MTSDSLGAQLTSWRVLDRLDSDHLPILTTFDIDSNRKLNCLKTSVTDWKGLKTTILKALDDLDPAERPDHLLEIISQSVHKYSEGDMKTSAKVCPWWDEDLETLRKLRNTLRNQKKHQDYKDAKREFRRVFRQKKKAYYADLLKSVAEDPNPWRVLRLLSPNTRTRRQVPGSPTYQQTHPPGTNM